MGQEKECRLRYCGASLDGKALLETDYLLFRGREKLKIFFRDLKSISADGGILRIEWAGGQAELDLGPTADKWAHKIQHPPSLLDKLGVKAGASVRLQGSIDAEFSRELIAAGATITDRKSDLIFLAASGTAELTHIPKLARTLAPAGGLWVIYPRGGGAIREIDVIQAARAAGLKDTKVVRFSTTHTGLRFVIPVAARQARRSASV